MLNRADLPKDSPLTRATEANPLAKVRGPQDTPDRLLSAISSEMKERGIHLEKCLGANPLSSCVSYRGTLERGTGKAQECVVKVYDYSALASLPLSALGTSVLNQSRKCWEAERDILTRVGMHSVAGHNQQSKNPKLPQLLDSFSFAGAEVPPFVNVLSYIPGRPLSHRLNSGNPIQPFTEPQARKLLEGILESLALLHRNGCVHRDVRPANIIEAPNRGKISLIDVNFAQLAEVTTFTSLEQSSWCVIPPDVHTRSNPPDGDGYAAGAIVIGALLGEDPGKLIGREFPLYGFLDLNEVSRRLPPLSPTFAATLERLCNPDHRHRPKDAAAALELLNSTSGAIAPLPPSLDFNRLLNATGKTFLELFEAEIGVAKQRQWSVRELARQAWCKEQLEKLPETLSGMAEKGVTRLSIGKLTWSDDIARMTRWQRFGSFFAIVNLTHQVASPALRAMQETVGQLGAGIEVERSWYSLYGGGIVKFAEIYLNLNKEKQNGRSGSK